MLKNGSSFSPCTNYCFLIRSVSDTTELRFSTRRNNLSKANSSFLMATLKRKSKSQSSLHFSITSTESRKKTNSEHKLREQQSHKNKKGKMKSKTMKKMKKSRRKTRINLSKNLSKASRKTRKPIKCKMRISKKPTNPLNSNIWVSAKMDAKSSLKSRLISRNSWWLKSYKRFLKIPSWNKFKELSQPSSSKEKEEFHTSKQKV